MSLRGGGRARCEVPMGDLFVGHVRACSNGDAESEGHLLSGSSGVGVFSFFLNLSVDERPRSAPDGRREFGRESRAAVAREFLARSWVRP